MSGLVAMSCGGTEPGLVSGDITGTVTVFAASSLTAAFTEIGESFTAASPDAEVVFNFAASSELVTQIREGAPADVFASADVSNMTKLVDAESTASDPVLFATNRAALIVGSGNPLGIRSVADLADDAGRDLVVVLCSPEVPCGRYATQVIERAGIAITPESFEENVKGVVSKVTLGEADAGIVYVTDIAAAGDAATGVDIPAEINVLAEYPIAVTTQAPNPAGAQAFVEFVAGPQGQQILASYGFGAAPTTP